MIPAPVSRREFLRWSAVAGAVTAAGSLFGCGTDAAVAPTMEAAALKARPQPFGGTAQRGFTTFNIFTAEDAYLYVPPSYRDDVPAPFLLLLHGAGGRAQSFATNLPSRVDDKGIVVLAVDSTGPTWDRINLGGFGPDITRIDLGLGYAFTHANIDPRRVAVGGFSDGASYALSIGVPNGDLFKGMIAFSPGALMSPGIQGKPKAFVSHGTQDAIIPIEASREFIVPLLREGGYDVTYREFVGGHQVPAEVANEAYNWLVALSS